MPRPTRCRRPRSTRSPASSPTPAGAATSWSTRWTRAGSEPTWAARPPRARWSKAPTPSSGARRSPTAGRRGAFCTTAGRYPGESRSKRPSAEVALLRRLGAVHARVDGVALRGHRLALIGPGLRDAVAQGGLPTGIGHARFGLVVCRVDGYDARGIMGGPNRFIRLVAGAAEADEDRGHDGGLGQSVISHSTFRSEVRVARTTLKPSGYSGGRL